MIDHVIHRVLGAVRFLDAAVALIDGAAAPLVVTDLVGVAAPGLTFRRNRRGYYVISRSSHPQLRLHHDAFEAPPAEPTVGSVSFTLRAQPLTRTYLPRTASFALPRDPDPEAADSLFVPIDVGLYRAPTAPIFPGWGALRVTVSDVDGGPVPGALVRVVEADDVGNVMGRGLSDWRGRARGQALVPVADLPTLGVSANGDGPVISQSIGVMVQAFRDPAFDPEAAPPDPDGLEERLEGLEASEASELELVAGRVASLTLSIP